jgi:molecular chaperone DnaK
MAAGTIIEEARQTQERLHEMAASIHDPKIETALGKLSSAVFLNPNETETEITQKAMDNVYEAKRLLAKVRKEHLKEIRKIELDREINVFNSQVKNLATVSEINAWDNMVKLAQRSIEHNDNEFESQIHEIRNIIFRVLWRQDWFVLKLFKSFAGSPFQYADRALFDNLTALGNQCLQRDEFDKLRDVVMKLAQSQIARGGDSDMFEMANIIRG